MKAIPKGLINRKYILIKETKLFRNECLKAFFKTTIFKNEKSILNLGCFSHFIQILTDHPI